MFSKVLGKNPSGSDLERIKSSPNYRNGAFQNQSPTEITLKDASFLKMMRDFLNKPKGTTPNFPIPAIETDLKTLASLKPAIVWFGHSSYFIKYRGVNILIDPVLSQNASPISAFAKSFPGSNIYSESDFPDIDVMILTHDHYDHLDYKTILQFTKRVKHFYVSLGVESHLKYWGVESARISSFDWWDSVTTKEGFTLTSAPGRHFAGRTLIRNKTLWGSFILQMDKYSIFIGGDSGYDTHFKEIGDKFGHFDIAFLESGQYNRLWPYIHLAPEEAITAAKDLNAKLLFPVHWGKFALAFHDWEEPIERVMQEARSQGMAVTTPMIGEAFYLGESFPAREWWKV